MKIDIFIYEGFTALDAIGPYEVLSRLPGADLRFLAPTGGAQRTDNGLISLEASPMNESGPLDVLVVSGGRGSRRLLEDRDVLDWLRTVHEQSEWTTSVCTGALLLGAAGLLRGIPATTHWLSIDRLAEFGAEPRQERIVEHGKVITAAGVSAGIDMALLLVARIAGQDVAEAIQLSIEYDPQPPFSSGSPLTARSAIVETVRSLSAAV